MNIDDLESFFNSKPFFVPMRIWRIYTEAEKSIGAKAFARIEAIKYHFEGRGLEWSNGNVLVMGGDSPVTLNTDLKRQEDFHVMLELATQVQGRIAADWDLAVLSDRPTWYRRTGWRVAMPLTCTVLFAPNGEWSRDAWLDLGAISAD